MAWMFAAECSIEYVAGYYYYYYCCYRCYLIPECAWQELSLTKTLELWEKLRD